MGVLGAIKILLGPSTLGGHLGESPGPRARAFAHVRPEVPRPQNVTEGITKPPCAACSLR